MIKTIINNFKRSLKSYEKNDWPNGELGQLMALALELKISGTDGLVKRLKKQS